MAEVFVAKRTGPHGFAKKVALKRILPQFSQDPDFVAMFVAEARLAARLEHPNIVQVFDFGDISGELYLAMELVDGTTVNRLLRAVSSRRETVPLDVALHIACQTARALAYAHKAVDDNGIALGIVHRDVSPANILLTRTGHVKLSDFGIARVAQGNTRTDHGHVRGKLGYMSPEQVTGRPLEARSDVFTLATVFAEMILAEPLFGTGSELNVLLRIRDTDLRVLERAESRCPQDLLRLLKSGLSREFSERPTASAFADTCEDIMRRRGVTNGPDRLARLLMRLELIPNELGEVAPEQEQAGGRLTSLVDTTGLSVDTEQVHAEGKLTSPEVYKVQLHDGQQVGPVSFPRLVQLITSGVVHSDTLIAKREGSFESASALPELTRFVTSPALQWKLEDITRANRKGELGAGRLLRIVHRIAVQRETGVLHLYDSVHRKKIYFVEGKPEFVSSTDKSELLGEYLVSSGMCLHMEVEMALALLPRYGGRLGDALVGLGVLRPVELFRAISEQVRKRFLEAFQWRKGNWAFVDGERSHEETFPLGHDTYELLRDGALQAHPAELEAALEPDAEKVLVRTSNPIVSMDAYRMPEEWQRLLNRVRGDTTFRAILARESSLGKDTVEVYRAFYLGLSCELIRALE